MPLLAEDLGHRHSFRVQRVQRESFGLEAASVRFSRRQLLLLGWAVRSPAHSPMRSASFIPNTLEVVTNRYVGKVGLPRLERVPVLGDAYRVAGGAQEFFQKVQTASTWGECVYGCVLFLLWAFDGASRGFKFSCFCSHSILYITNF